MTVVLEAHTKEQGEEAEWDRKRNWRELLHILNERDEVRGTGEVRHAPVSRLPMVVNFNLF